ncbi:MAG: Hpt domain-containing protein, partial [Ancalomicrobiaceae bacterium]|nr:Hpt domain-containing protein [Ancalomicrobiaceae bacterium]
MDDLLREFLTETNESLDVVDVELVKFEQDPNNAKILDNIFRLVHTIKGTCGFLGLPRLEAIAHAAETLMGKFRDGVPVTATSVNLVLASIDRIKGIVADLEASEQEPAGSDVDLIKELEHMSEGGAEAAAAAAAAAASPAKPAAPKPAAAAEPPTHTEGTLVFQILERQLRPGEVSLDELERAFRETPVEQPPEDTGPIIVRTEEQQAKANAKSAAKAAVAERREARDKDKEKEKDPAESETKGSVASQSIRVSVDTLEHLMTMVSELVLTRNQLLEIVRRHEDSEFKVPLQRLSNVTAELQEGVMKTRMQPIG